MRKSNNPWKSGKYFDELKDNVETQLQVFVDNYDNNSSKHLKSIYDAINLFLSFSNKNVIQSKHEVNKTLIIKLHCVLELLLKPYFDKKEWQIKSFEINRLCRLLISDNTWYRQRIGDVISSLTDFRNSITHKFTFLNTSKKKTSDESVANIINSARNVLYILFAKFIDEDGTLNFREDKIKTSWNKYINLGLEFSSISSKFDEKIDGYLRYQFGSLEIINYFTLGLDAYGGMMYPVDLKISFVDKFYPGEVIRENRVLPGSYDFIVEEICSRLKLSSFNSSKLKSSNLGFLLFNKASQVQSLIFAYIFESKFPETSLSTFLRLPSDMGRSEIVNLMPSENNQKLKKYSEQNIWEKEAKTLKAKNLIIIHLYKEEISLPNNLGLIDIHPKGDLEVTTQEEAKQNADILIELFSPFIQDIEKVHFYFRGPTPIAVYLGRYLFKQKKSVVIYDRDFETGEFKEMCTLVPEKLCS